jgi:hypothetical protein
LNLFNIQRSDRSLTRNLTESCVSTNEILTQVYLGYKFCTSLLEIAGLRVPARYIRDFAMFSVCSSSRSCPPGCASAANVVSGNVGIFGTNTVTHKLIL